MAERGHGCPEFRHRDPPAAEVDDAADERQLPDATQVRAGNGAYEKPGHGEFRLLVLAREGGGAKRSRARWSPGILPCRTSRRWRCADSSRRRSGRSVPSRTVRTSRSSSPARGGEILDSGQRDHHVGCAPPHPGLNSRGGRVAPASCCGHPVGPGTRRRRSTAGAGTQWSRDDHRSLSGPASP